MPRPGDEHSIEREPHRRPDDAAPDDAERRAERTLARESARGDAEEELARHSVFNEPGAMFPPGSPAHRSGTITRDWSCDHCGYDLRGLEAGRRCPECGKTSLSRPAPVGAVSYASLMRRKLDERTVAGNLAIAVGVAVAGGVWAVGTSFALEAFGTSGSFLGIAVMAPLLEEVLKIALLAAVLERRPWLFRSRAQVMAVALTSAILFATIENALYLFVYLPSPSNATILWRLIVCTGLHAGCTALAAKGLAAAWEKSATELREPDIAPFTRLLVLAIVIHGVYNAAMLFAGYAGFSF